MSENRYAEWLNREAQLGYESASSVKKWKQGEHTTRISLNLRKLAQVLSGVGAPTELVGHRLWELERAFGSQDWNGTFSPHYEAESAGLMRQFSFPASSPDSGPPVSVHEVEVAPSVDVAQSGPQLPGLAEVIDFSAACMLKASDGLWSAIADAALGDLARSKSRNSVDADEIVVAFSTHKGHETRRVAINTLFAVMDGLLAAGGASAPPMADLAALDALFHLCLIRFAVRALPGDLEAGDGVTRLPDIGRVAIPLVQEAWRGGQSQFEEGAQDGDRSTARASNHIGLSFHAVVPGQAAAVQMREVAAHLDSALDPYALPGSGRRLDHLGETAPAGRIRAVIEEFREVLFVHWRGRLSVAQPQLQQAVDVGAVLYKDLGLPCIVTPSAADSMPAVKPPYLRADADYLEQTVLQYLRRRKRLEQPGKSA